MGPLEISGSGNHMVDWEAEEEERYARMREEIPEDEDNRDFEG